MKMTQEQQIRHYRKMIQQLEEENRTLKSRLVQYDGKGFIKLVDETQKMKTEYEMLMKQALECRNEYEKILAEQRRLNKRYAVTR